MSGQGQWEEACGSGPRPADHTRHLQSQPPRGFQSKLITSCPVQLSPRISSRIKSQLLGLTHKALRDLAPPPLFSFPSPLHPTSRASYDTSRLSTHTSRSPLHLCASPSVRCPLISFALPCLTQPPLTPPELGAPLPCSQSIPSSRPLLGVTTVC